MKRIIGVILCAFVACVGALHLITATETVNSITWAYTVSNGAASLGGRPTTPAVPTSTKGAIMIPSSLGGYPVTSIGYGALRGCSGLTVVTVEIPTSAPDVDDFTGEVPFYFAPSPPNGFGGFSGTTMIS